MKHIALHEFESLCAVPDGARGDRMTDGAACVGIPQRRFDLLDKYLRSVAGKDLDADQLMRFQRRGGRDLITARNYVGVIRFADGAQIEILPKIELSGADENATRKIFLKMLRALLNFEDKAKSSGRAHVDDSRMRVFDVFVRRFLDDLAALVKRGLKGGYSTVSGNEHFFKGKLKVAENIRHNIVHRERFFVEYDVFSTDAPENRLIRAALERLRIEVGDAGCRNDINRLLPVFEEVPRSKNVDADLAAAKAVRNGELYKSVIDWCGVFLMRRGFAAFSGSHDVQALLFPMERIFEAYVAHVVRKYASMDGWSVSVQEQGKYLFANENDKGQRFDLRPDIVLRMEGEVIIADTKWKRLNRDNPHYGVSQGDMYQMYAYGKRYSEDSEGSSKRKVRVVHLIYPKSWEGENEIVYSDGNKAEGNNDLCVKIDLFDFDMLGDASGNAEKSFAKKLIDVGKLNDGQGQEIRDSLC